MARIVVCCVTLSLLVACGQDRLTSEELARLGAGVDSGSVAPPGPASGSGGSPIGSGGTGGSAAGGSGNTGSGGGPGGAVGSGGAPASGRSDSGASDVASSGSGGTVARDGAAGGATGAGGTAGGGAGGGGGGGTGNPYAPRSGPFKMLAYSKTAAFRHSGSIATGHAMLDAIAAEQGFQVEHTETNTWLQRLNEFEILFFMNPTGDIFTDAEQKTFEDWMRAGGAFAGTHSATDTENGWAFYSEVTGQYYNGHGAQNTMGQIRFEDGVLTHPAVVGLPNPWVRSEEWYNFNSWQTWTAKPGFKVLGRLTTGANQPISYLREWGNFRSFYTAIGHADVVFKDATVKKHITGGIMWAVRREHLIK